MIGGITKMQPRNMKNVFFAFISAIVGSMLFASVAQAATVDVASVTVLYPDETPAEGVRVSMHNGNSSISVNRNTDENGIVLFEIDSEEAEGERLTIELQPPTGYIAPNEDPSSYPYLFDFDAEMDQLELEFTLVAAPKTINVNVVDTDGTPVQNADVLAIPVGDDAFGQANGTASEGEATLNTTGGTWVVNVMRNLSERNPERYPWVAIGGSQELTFNEDDSEESGELTFEVARSETLITVKPVDAEGNNLTENSFNGDVSFVGYTEYGPVSTQAKVDPDTGVASLYLLPGIYRVDAYHSQLENQSFDPADTVFILTDEAGTTDWGTIQAEYNTASISGSLTVQSGGFSGAELGAQDAQNVSVTATHMDSGRSYSTQTDAEGAFTIQNLGAGDYAVSVSQENYLALQNSTVTVSSGAEVQGIMLTAAQVQVTVTGNVTDADGAVLENVPASVVATVNDKKFASPVSSDGSYTIQMYDANASQVQLQLVTQKGATVFMAAPLTIELVGQTIRQDLATSNEEVTISGSITSIQDGTTVTSEEFDVATVTLLNTENGSVEEAAVADAGTFTAAVAPGTWELVPRITGPNATAVAGMITDVSATVLAGDSVSGVEVPVHTTNGGSASGTIVDTEGAAVAEARVVFSNAAALEVAAEAADTDVDPAQIVTVVASTNADGEYSVALPDGTYTVAFSEHPSVSAIAPESEAVTIDGAAVEIGQSAFRSAESTISGTVESTVAGDNIVFTSEDGGYVETTSTGGKFEVNLPTGEWDVVVSGISTENGKLVVEQQTITVDESTETVAFEDFVDTGVTVPVSVVSTCDAGEVCTVSNDAGAQIRLSPYAADSSGTVTVQVAPVVDLSVIGETTQVGIAYEIDVWNDDGVAVSQLSRPADITLPIDEELKGSDVADDELVPAFYQPDLKQFLNDGLVAGTNGDSMTIQTNHLTRFAVTTYGDLSAQAGSTKEALLGVDTITRLSNNTVRVTYDSGAEKTFRVFPKGTAKAKVQLHTNGDILVALNKTYLRTIDVYSGEKIAQQKLFKKKQYKTKFARYNVYKKKAGQNNVVVLAQTKKSQKSDYKLRSFVIKNRGAIVRRKVEHIALDAPVKKFSNLKISKNSKNGKNARIRVKKKKTLIAKYKVTKKKGILVPVE